MGIEVTQYRGHMSSHMINVREESGIPIISIVGYFSEETGSEVESISEEYFRRGQARLILDFTNCKVINSPGASSLLWLVSRVNDEFSGILVMVGLREIQLCILKMAMVIPPAISVGSVAEGLKELTAKSS